ncbi:hypothetical protein CH272_18160 [Rhodococcus sp. 05-340-1]|nr:hypothetical protein CH254_14645 [Rhodococcus sp. 06-412-2C]OZC96440.1 hypothetical protein CH279_14810 [Rhodococcus sp. 06-412-2B]OZD59737.1 hypothetical protein CH268_15605 [Rhodococcus sp. 06-1460-1B]OZD65424.1 hypothetical protein CH271_20630 [Rhodococcus sp. 05-340-2]OZD74529.1 hypothetical protein CH272_18160 [Rhodococcus sp. 05-340-1]OZE37334.1 hypothetical protein CH259_10620 [Rhodococcus sp. 05-2254-4]OZE45002.1 hypothetical protein CH261_13280 [Rhodococcus sp. 05-2254-3]OZE45459
MIAGRCRICTTAEVRGMTVCDRCRKRATQHRGTCAGCRKPDKLLDDADTCRWCRQKARRTCTCCDATGSALTGAEGDTLCHRCTLTRRLDAIIPPHADGPLAPLRQPLLHAEPVTTRRWLIRTTPLLLSIQDGSTALTHTSFDTLPHPKSVEHLRSLLVATGILGPDLDRSLRRLEAQLPQLLSSLTPNHRALLTRWTQWAVLPRLRAATEKREGHVGAQNARSQIRQSALFLDLLQQRSTELGECTQHDIDTWFSAPGAAHWRVRSFLTWARRNRHLPRTLTLPSSYRGRAEVPTDDDERWQICRRLVHDESLDPADRLAGALIALFAQPLTRIAGLTTAHVTETDAGVELRLGSADTLLLPDPFAQIALQLPRPRRAGTAEQIPQTWLFPGHRADIPLTATALGNRLRRIGISPQALRLSAIAHLTRELPPSALAAMLGLNAHTVAQHTLRASGQWANYAADRHS